MKENIETLLQERLSSAKKELSSQEKLLKKLRKLPILARNDELIASVSYTIGFLNAVIYENELFLSLYSMTGEEIKEYIVRKKKIEASNAKEMKRLFAEIIERKKT